MRYMKRWISTAWSVSCALILLSAASSAWAQAEGRSAVWQPSTLLSAIASTLVFGLIGIVMAIVGFKLFDLLSPFNLEREVCEKQNIAVAILCAAMVLGICLIVAAAVL